MSYMQCRICGHYMGVIGNMIIKCACPLLKLSGIVNVDNPPSESFRFVPLPNVPPWLTRRVPDAAHKSSLDYMKGI